MQVSRPYGGRPVINTFFYTEEPERDTIPLRNYLRTKVMLVAYVKV